jgi:hypothetical protein
MNACDAGESAWWRGSEDAEGGEGGDLVELNLL